MLKFSFGNSEKSSTRITGFSFSPQKKFRIVAVAESEVNTTLDGST